MQSTQSEAAVPLRKDGNFEEDGGGQGGRGGWVLDVVDDDEWRGMGIEGVAHEHEHA